MTGETLVVRGRPAVGSVRAGRLCGPDDSSFDFSVMCRADGWEKGHVSLLFCAADGHHYYGTRVILLH